MIRKGEGIHWMSWDGMCVAKEAGGMGFKSTALIWQCLISKDEEFYQTLAPSFHISLKLNISQERTYKLDFYLE